MKPINEEFKPWGSYAPSGYRNILAIFIKLGLSHGFIKKWLGRLWFHNSDSSPVDLVYNKVKFRLQPWDNVVERKILFGSKRRDWTEIRFLTSTLNQNSVFFDIGANIGYYSCMVAASGVCRVIAVEPHPVTQRRLKFNIEANGLEGRVSIAPYAIGSEASEVVLTTRGGDLGSSSVGTTYDGIPVVQYQVEMVSLVELCGRLNVTHIDAAKIDIEGLEDKVLIPFFENAPASLWPDHIIIEHAHSTDWSGDLFEKMRQCGYRAGMRTRANSIYSRTAHPTADR